MRGVVEICLSCGRQLRNIKNFDKEKFVVSNVVETLIFNVGSVRMEKNDYFLIINEF